MAKPKISNSQGNCPDAFRLGENVIFRDTKNTDPDAYFEFTPTEWEALKWAFETREYEYHRLEHRPTTVHVDQP